MNTSYTKNRRSRSETSSDTAILTVLNVTIPYKKTAVSYCADLSDSARRIGSVNTVVRRPDGGLFGDNTDVDGFRYLLECVRGSVPGASFSGKKALVLGSGGASLTVVSVLRGAGAEPVVLSRTGAEQLRQRVFPPRRRRPDRQHDAGGYVSRHRVVARRPCGLRPVPGRH